MGKQKTTLFALYYIKEAITALSAGIAEGLKIVITKKFTIINKLGLHARAAAKLVHLASRFSSEIKLMKNQHSVNSKSIMGVMMLAASKGTELELIVAGEDEIQATEEIIALINNRFGEAE